MKDRSRFRRWLRPIAPVVAPLFLVAGCGSSSTPPVAAPTRPSTPAVLQIVTPGPNEQTGPRVLVTLRLEHAHVVPATQVGGALRPDAGHIHLSVDGRLVAMPQRLDYALTRLAPGGHTIEAEFVASDHVPFANRVVAAVTFEVR